MYERHKKSQELRRDEERWKPVSPPSLPVLEFSFETDCIVWCVDCRVQSV